MARSKGSKNQKGHKAGGARRGAGRKRKSTVDDHDGQLESLTADIPSIPDNFVDGTQTISSLHRPVLQPLESLSEISSNIRLPSAVWNSAIGELRFSADTGSSSSPAACSPTLTPIVHRKPRLAQFSIRAPPSSSSTSDLRVTRTPPPSFEVNDAQIVRSPELPGSQRENRLQTKSIDTRAPTPPGVITPATPASSRVNDPRTRLAYIAPNYISQQPRACRYPFPASLHHPQSVASQGLFSRRRRRRCVVCAYSGQNDASYNCPGRGDRSRCPFYHKCSEVAYICKTNQMQKDKRTLLDSTWQAPNPLKGSQLLAPSTSTSSVLVPRGLVLPISHGNPAQHFLLSLCETAKRRARRCMVCIAKGNDGTSCVGRGKRRWCPSYKEDLDT